MVRTSHLIDEERWDEWGSVLSEGFVYELCAYSTELRKEMSWLVLRGREQLLARLAQLSHHHRDMATRLHLVTPVDVTQVDERATAVSNFSVFRTTAAGDTTLYVVGRYHDELVRAGSQWLFGRRTVRLHTRIMDGAAGHLPI
ncbi:MAG: aromatic-ring-hydroxylating dioxygenase subunit beta [Chloroflexota bacterium]